MIFFCEVSKSIFLLRIQIENKKKCGGWGGGGEAGVINFFSKILNLKNKNVWFCVWGVGRGAGGNEFFTKNPNLKKNRRWGEGGGGEWEARVSVFFY